MATAMPVIFPRQFGHSGPPPSQEYLDENNVIFILSLTGTFTAAAVLVVILRMYVRICMLRFVGFDDWTMVLAALMALGSFTCMCGESFYGMGRHVEWPQPWMIGPLFRWIFAHGIIVMLGVVLVKISVAFFLMRIMLKKGWQIFLCGSIVFLTCFGLACTGTLLFQCSPISASWNVFFRRKPNVRCFSLRTYSFIGLFNSVINITTDVLFAILPIPVILKLQVNRRTKASLIVVLSLGFFACVAGVLKARLQVKLPDMPDQGFENWFNIWYMLELCFGILAASLPTLRPLFSAVLDGTLSRLGSRSRSRNTSGRAHAGFSRVQPCGPTPFPHPTNDVDLQHFKTGSGGNGDGRNATGAGNGQQSRGPGSTTRTESISAPSDVEKSNTTYNVRVVGGAVGDDDDDRDQWASLGMAQTRSEERLHRPAAGIFKRVDMTRTSEAAR